MSQSSQEEEQVEFVGVCRGGPWSGDTVRGRSGEIELHGPYVEFNWPVREPHKTLIKTHVIGKYEFAGPGLWLWIEMK